MERCLGALIRASWTYRLLVEVPPRTGQRGFPSEEAQGAMPRKNAVVEEDGKPAACPHEWGRPRGHPSLEGCSTGRGWGDSRGGCGCATSCRGRWWGRW